MSDSTFDRRLTRELDAYADSVVRPIDAVELAGQAMSAGTGPLGPARRVSWLAAAAVVAALLLAAMFLITVGGRPRLVDAPPLVSPTPSAVASAGPLPIELGGSWIADKPDDLSFGDSVGPARMSLVVDANGTFTYVLVSRDPRERLQATASAVGDEVHFIARAPGDLVSLRGIDLRGCTAGEAGRYRIARTPDGLLLTLETIDDPCPSRAAVLARTWVRSLGSNSTGGLGVVDAFDPIFTAELPAGTYTAERGTDALTVLQPIPEFHFLAFKNPQGFNDPCDPVGGGRRSVGPGADAFVAYFRQLRGFTVDSTTELLVDGHRAVRLVVHADADASCPSGRLAEWQPKTETGDQHWFLRPGDTDSLVIVELADATLMFEVLPAPHALEADVIGSIRFLERLPGAP